MFPIRAGIEAGTIDMRSYDFDKDEFIGSNGTTYNMNDSLSLNGLSQILLQFDVTSSEDKITIKSGTIYCFPIKFLHTLNTTSYTPTNNYHPATKKYVDDAISNTVGTIETTLQTINSGSGV